MTDAADEWVAANATLWPGAAESYATIEHQKRC